MSQLGQTRKSVRLNGKSVLPPTADVDGPPRHVRVVPNCDMVSVLQFGISGCKSGERSRSMVFATGSPGNASNISR
jgi:hypothetical protein